jgi:hypothetical protein
LGNNRKQNPDARLEDLDVREVSVVDRPANRRRFLIVKNADGTAEIEFISEDGISTEDMMRSAILPSEREARGLRTVEPVDKDDTEVTDEDSDSSAFELVSLIDGFDVDEPDRGHEDAGDEDDDKPPIEPIEKQGKVGEVLRAVNAWVGQLTALVNQIRREEGGGEEQAADGDKKEKAGKLSAGVAGKLSSLSGTIKQWLSRVGGSAGGKDEDKEATEKAASAGAAAALQRLMAVAAALKGLDASADVPSQVVAAVRQAATGLDSVLSTYGPEQQRETKKSARLQVFVEKRDDDEDDDPEIIVKAGAKMKRTRLSKLKQAAYLLVSLLKELSPEDVEDEDKDKDKKGKKRRAAKSEEPTLTAATIAEAVEGVVSKVVEKALAKEAPAAKDDGDVAPAGNAASDPPDTEGAESVEKAAGKPKKSLFHNLFTR